VNLTSTAGSVTLGTLAASGNLAVNSAGGTITQSAGASLNVGGTSTLQASAAGMPADITLTNAANTFAQAVSASGAAISLTDAGPLTLGRVAASGNLTLASTGALDLGTSTVGGNLTANSGNGSVTQSGPLAVTGTTGIVAGTGVIKLNDPGNALNGKLTTTGSDVSVVGQQAEATANASETIVSQLASSMLASASATQPGEMSQQSPSFNGLTNASSAASAADDSSSPTVFSDGTGVQVTRIGVNGPALSVFHGGVHLPENAMSFDE
jgi:hypothetical protein